MQGKNKQLNRYLRKNILKN